MVSELTKGPLAFPPQEIEVSLQPKADAESKRDTL